MHPYELKATNYLLGTHEAIQFPVFPLLPLRGFPTSSPISPRGPMRTNSQKIILPPWSVATAARVRTLRRDGLRAFARRHRPFGDADVLPQDSLTEDYRMSLTLYESGVQLYYVLEQIPRVSPKNELCMDLIATRSMFPNTFRTAVRQKSRWILGITMQSFRFREIFHTPKLRFSARYYAL